MQDDNSLKIDPIALEHSEKLQDIIKNEIASKGEMTFDRFMELALYAPGLGYYTAGSQKFGSSGDFVTAPEISSIFSKCLANQCAEILTETQGSILEFGAGSGVMAAHILKHLEAIDCLPEQYLILDLSPELKVRQKETINNIVPHLLERVVWLDTLPTSFTGVIVGNEVLDAMPVSVFRKDHGEIQEQYVQSNNGALGAVWKQASDALKAQVEAIELSLEDFADGYVSEINNNLPTWIASLAEMLDKGAILLIDYGYAAAEYYHVERSMGTLICHYQHQAHDDPFKLIGLQDITANVDFSAVKQSAQASGLEIAGYTTQAHFLVSTGLEELVAEVSPEDTENFLKMTQRVKVLMMPSEMGERFKVIGLTKNINPKLQGFLMRDFSDRL